MSPGKEGRGGWSFCIRPVARCFVRLRCLECPEEEDMEPMRARSVRTRRRGGRRCVTGVGASRSGTFEKQELGEPVSSEPWRAR